MRIRRIGISHFKQLDVDLPLPSAVVLFGPNDSGKTNILEGLVSGIDQHIEIRTQPQLSNVDRHSNDSDRGEVSILFELDGLDIEGHPDQELFLSLMPLREGIWASGIPDERGSGLLECAKTWTWLRETYAGLARAQDRAQTVAQLVQWVREAIRQTEDEFLTIGGAIDRPESLMHEQYEYDSHLFLLQEGAQLSWLSASQDPGATPLAIVLAGHHSFFDAIGVRTISVGDISSLDQGLLERLEHLVVRTSDRDRVRVVPTDEPFMEPLKVQERVNDPWVDRLNEGVVIRPIVEQACARLAAMANELAPVFVSSKYEIVVAPLAPDEWRAYGDHRVAIRLRALGTDECFDISVASSGVSAWTAYAVQEAVRRASEELAVEESEGGFRPPSHTIYVLDEPEAHLHPLAQEEAARWVAQIAQSGAHVVLATHATPFLSLPLADVEYLLVTRAETHETQVQAISEDVLGAVSGSASSLGLPPAALIQLTHAWLVVEGEHDRKIVDYFCGSDLRRSKVRVLPLRGAARAKASFMNLEALAPLRIPFFVLLDNTRSEAPAAGSCSEPVTEEERIAEQLRRLGEREEVDITPLSWPYPDIICALPIDAVRRVARSHGGNLAAGFGWDDLVEGFRLRQQEAQLHGGKLPDFKRSTLEELGVGRLSVDQFVDEALRACEDAAPTQGPLDRLVSQVVAAVEGRVKSG